MKTFKTKLLTIAALLIGLQASAHDFEVDGIFYNITSSDELEVTYDETLKVEYTGSITIPESVTYEGKTYSVTSIGDETFMDWPITDIIIPNTVESIGEEAFRRCKNLKILP